LFTWLYNKGKRKGEILELFPTPLKQIPIPPRDLINAKEIEHLVKQILNDELSEELQIDYESRINHLVNQLYGLSSDEIRIVNEFWNEKHK